MLFKNPTCNMQMKDLTGQVSTLIHLSSLHNGLESLRKDYSVAWFPQQEDILLL